MIGLWCGCCLSLFAQGISFREGSWQEILDAAKKENKLVFIDNYTSWCGPCKKMVKEIFPLKEVGDFYNANFVCYKLDCEKGDGVEVARTYKIHSFPTYLFIDGNGKLFYRSGSYMSAEKFIAEGKIALEEYTDKRTIEEWDALYARKKNQPAFVKAYLAKRNRAKLDNADVLDQYLTIAKDKELSDPAFLKELAAFGTHVKAGGACAGFILKHGEEIARAASLEEKDFAQILDYNIVHYSYNRAVTEKNGELFEKVLLVNGVLAPKLGKNAADEEIKLRSCYLAATGQAEEFGKIAGQHADILFREEKGVLERDAVLYKEYLQEIIARPEQLASQHPDQLAFSLKFAGVNESSNLSFAFRDLAANVARLSDDSVLLAKAMVWALQAVTLFDNFTNYEALAEVLYKLGYKKEALWEMQKAADKMPAGNDAIATRIGEKLNKMKNEL